MNSSISVSRFNNALHQNEKFFSIEISDVEFKSTSIIVEEIKKYCKEVGYEIAGIYISKFFHSDFQRQDGQMKTVSKISIVRHDDGKVYAHYLSECQIL